MAILRADIGEIYSLIKFIVNKDQQGYVSPPQFNEAFNTAQLQLFKHFYGPVEQYQPGRPIPRVAFAMTQKVHDALSPFITIPTPLALSPAGQAVIPDEYVHPVALRNIYTKTLSTSVTSYEEGIDGLCNYDEDFEEQVDTEIETELREVSVSVIEQDRIGKKLSSRISPPTQEYPYAVFYADYIQFYPKDCNPVFEYLHYPPKAEWKATRVNARDIYDAASSIQPLWRKMEQNDLVVRTLSLFGINLKAMDVTQYAQLKQAEGL